MTQHETSPLLKLVRSPEIPVATGEKHFTRDEALFPCSYLKAILRAKGNLKAGLTFLRQHERFSGDTVASRENTKLSAATRETQRDSSLPQ